MLISKKVSIYSPQKISIGNNVRIDDFCILSGNITLGNYCRIAACGAMTLVNRDLEAWTINTGIPPNKTRPRKKRFA